MSAPDDLPQTAARRISRITGLDFIRGIAILLVLCRHLHLAPPCMDSSLAHQALFVLQRGGWCGVDLFFVLSGFLISGILFRQYQRHGSIRVGDFLIRRGFKIYPAFWMMLEATVVYNLLAGGGVPVKALMVELLFVQNYLKGIYGHTWSLAVEEHCYLGIAVLFLGLTWIFPRSASFDEGAQATSDRVDDHLKNGLDRGDSHDPFWLLPFLTLLGLGAAWWMRIRLLPGLEKNGPPSILFPSHLRFDGFLAGTLLAYLASYRANIFRRLCSIGRTPWVTLGVLLLMPVFVYDIREDPIVIRWCFTANIAVALCWILAAHTGPIPHRNANRSCEQKTDNSRVSGNDEHRRNSISLLKCVSRGIQGIGRTSSRAIEFIGQNSYSIYLWHDLLEHSLVRPLLKGFVTFPVERVDLWVPTYMFLTIGGGIAMAYLVERPALAWRDRWFPHDPQS